MLHYDDLLQLSRDHRSVRERDARHERLAKETRARRPRRRDERETAASLVHAFAARLRATT